MTVKDYLEEKLRRNNHPEEYIAEVIELLRTRTWVGRDLDKPLEGYDSGLLEAAEFQFDQCQRHVDLAASR